MLRERASDANGNGFHGNGDGTAVDAANTPRTESIFLDDSQAPHVVSGDGVEERRPEMVAEEGDIIQGVESERGAQAGRGSKRIIGALLGAGALVVAAVGIWFMVGNGATRKAKVPVNAGSSNSAQQTAEGMTRQAIQELDSGPGATLC